MDALARNIQEMDTFAASCYAGALRLKQAGALGDVMAPTPMGGLGDWRRQSQYKERYSLNQGWVNAALDALGREGAGQAVRLGRLTEMPTEAQERNRLSRTKDYWCKRMTATARSKAQATSRPIEVIENSPLLLSLEQPNPIQHRWQFVYSFFLNLGLTGWGFIVRDMTKDGRHQFFSLPTSWITPDHSKGPFSGFTISNPKKPGVKKEPIKRELVGFAHIPDPSDPLSARAPAGAQMSAIRIDDHIQTSQEQFFDNGIFPSVVLTVGKEPLGQNLDRRPRLTAAQRRQVESAIMKVSAGVQNYGRPAIVDGLIERIERLSATQTEMGWEKSEDRVADRILSAFGVHRYILGYAVNVGGYAQAAKIEERFAKRVNTYLDMLGNLMTNMVGIAEQDEGLLVWWDQCEPHDPQQHNRLLIEGRKNGDLTRDEYRAAVGYPPAEEEEAKRNKLLDSVGGVTGAVAMFTALNRGEMQPEQAAFMLRQFYQIAGSEAEQAVGEQSEQEALEDATEALERAVDALGLPASVIAGRIEEAVKA